MKLSAILSFAVFLLLSAVQSLASELSNGWGDSIDWKTLEDAKAAAATNHKPIMLVIHKSWCGACQALKPQFASSSDIAELSRAFNMVNTVDDQEPQGDEFTPDGGYIPRILFLDATGTVRKELHNVGGSSDYKYYYSHPEGIVASMNKAIETLKPTPSPGTSEL